MSTHISYSTIAYIACLILQYRHWWQYNTKIPQFIDHYIDIRGGREIDGRLDTTRRVEMKCVYCVYNTDRVFLSISPKHAYAYTQQKSTEKKKNTHTLHIHMDTDLYNKNKARGEH